MSRDSSRLKGVPWGAGRRVSYTLQISLLSVKRVPLRNVRGSVVPYRDIAYVTAVCSTKNTVRLDLSVYKLRRYAEEIL